MRYVRESHRMEHLGTSGSNDSSAPEFDLRHTFFTKLGGTFVIRVIALALGLVVQIVLARLLGTAGYGTFSLAFTIATLAGMIASFGFNQYLVREVASGVEGQRFGYVHGLLRFSFRFALLLALVGGALLALLITLLQWPAETGTRHAVLLALISVPIYALINQRQGALGGLHRVEQGQLPENLLRPLLFLAAIGCMFLWWRETINEVNVVLLNLGALFIAVTVGGLLMRGAIPKAVKTSAPEAHTRSWLLGAGAFLLISGMATIQSQTDIVMIGAIRDVEQVGLYTVPARLAGLITFLFFASNLVIAPMIARLWEQKDKAGLQQLVRRASRFVTLVTLPFALVLVVAPGFLLGFFGHEFKGGGDALVILTIGWFLNIALGPVTFLLSMTGHERLIARIVALSTLVNIALNAILIPTYGIEGAAVATGVSFLVWKITAMFMVRRKIGIAANGLM